MTKTAWFDPGEQLPSHHDGVRVITADQSGHLTHGLASHPDPARVQDETNMLGGWKLWYFQPDTIPLRVVAWSELEKLDDGVPVGRSTC